MPQTSCRLYSTSFRYAYGMKCIYRFEVTLLKHIIIITIVIIVTTLLCEIWHDAPPAGSGA